MLKKNKIKRRNTEPSIPPANGVGSKSTDECSNKSQNAVSAVYVDRLDTKFSISAPPRLHLVSCTIAAYDTGEFRCDHYDQTQTHTYMYFLCSNTPFDVSAACSSLCQYRRCVWMDDKFLDSVKVSQLSRLHFQGHLVSDGITMSWLSIWFLRKLRSRFRDFKEILFPIEKPVTRKIETQFISVALTVALVVLPESS